MLTVIQSLLENYARNYNFIIDKSKYINGQNIIVDDDLVSVSKFNLIKKWEYENKLLSYLRTFKIGKVLSPFEIFKKYQSGEYFEFGVFKAHR